MGTTRTGLRDVAQGKAPSRLRLLAPLRYLEIQHPERFRYNFAIPVITAIIAFTLFCVAKPAPAIFSDAGILKYLRDILIMAVPFMVGALAAVSMGAPGPYLDRRFAGAELILDNRILTARQFVCYLLGYLCFLGMTSLGLTVLAPLLRDAVLNAVAGDPLLLSIIYNIGSFLMFLLISALTVTIYWSLYFLTDVVNRPIHQQEPPAN